MKKMAVIARPLDGEPGGRESDFCWAIEGEIALPSQPCDRDQEDLDGECGCRRSFTGVNSCLASTTVMVIQRVFTDEQMALIVNGHYMEHWPGCHQMPGEALEWMKQFDAYEVGTVLEQREVIQTRHFPTVKGQRTSGFGPEG